MHKYKSLPTQMKYEIRKTLSTKTCTENLIESDRILKVIDYMENRLNVTIPKETNANIKEEELNIAASEFLYLFSCSDMSRAWILFYKNLFKNKAPDEILLTLNRILKGKNGIHKNDMMTIAKRLFKRYSAMIHTHYEHIQNLFYGMYKPPSSYTPHQLKGENFFCRNILYKIFRYIDSHHSSSSYSKRKR